MTLTVPASDLSPLERFALLPDVEREEVKRRLSIEDRAALLGWHGLRRPSQTPPDDDQWMVFLEMGGRGSGKTKSGSEETIEGLEAAHAKLREVIRCAVVAPTFGDFRDTDVEGESGLLACLEKRGIKTRWNRSNGELSTDRWFVKGYSSVDPDRLRGPQFHRAWLDEPGAFRYPKAVWDTLLPAMRLGPDPKILITGTPKVTWLMKFLVAQCRENPARYRMSRMSTWRNRANLPENLLEELVRAYAGTRLGRQELEGELLEEAEGALWSLEVLERNRVLPSEVPSDLRKIVGVDPAVTATAESDETGIVVCGATYDRYPVGYVLDDLSGRWTPDQWGRKVIEACKKWGTSEVVVEVNQGGDLVESNILAARTADDPPVRVTKIHAKKAKALRAGPVSTLYEQDRVKHVGVWPELETQAVMWVPGQEGTGVDSPDRIDALVYAILELIPEPRLGGSVSVLTGSVVRR